MFGSDPAMLDGAVETARDADVIVAVVGGSSSRFAAVGEFDTNGAMKSQSAITMDCGENVASASLVLPGDQIALLTRLKATGKPVITVVIAGRPYEMGQIDRNSDALIMAFYPGPTGGDAVAKLLFGDIEPAGRLSASLPDDGKALPCYYNHKDSYAPMRYFDGVRSPKYAFGMGLGYTDFSYRLMDAPNGDSRQLKIAVTNVGSRPGYAVPQLYLHRTPGVVTSRVRTLCAFQKCRLEPGEGKILTLDIPDDALMQWDYAMNCRLIPGRIQWFLCDNGETKLEGEFTL